MKGYYLWDWYSTKTIQFDSDIDFHSDEYAQDQDCYRRFDDAKRAGIKELEYQIDLAQQQLEALKKLTVKDVKK